MTHTTNRPALPADQARAIWAQNTDPYTHAVLGLLLLTGLRVGEVQDAHVRDYNPDGPRLHVGTVRHPRTIVLPASAATALDGYLATQDTSPEDFLLPEATTMRLVPLVRATARQAGVEAGVHDLRHAAIAAVIEDGAPAGHVQAYFGYSAGPPRETDPPLRDGWDRGVARSLEAAFCG